MLNLHPKLLIHVLSHLTFIHLHMSYKCHVGSVLSWQFNKRRLDTVPFSVLKAQIIVREDAVVEDKVQ